MAPEANSQKQYKIGVLRASQNMAKVKVKEETDLCDGEDAENSQIKGSDYLQKLVQIRNEDQEYTEHFCIKVEQEEQEMSIKQEEERLPEFTSILDAVKSEDNSAMFYQRPAVECKLETNGEDSGGPKPDYSSDSQRIRYLQSDNTANENSSDTEDSDDWNREPSSSTRPEADSSLDPYRHLDPDTDSDNWSWEWEPPDRSTKPIETAVDEEECTKKRLTNARDVRGKTKQHQCSVCKKAFVDNTGLKRHVLIHTGQRPFICVLCKKDFTRKCHLKSHMRTHSNEKPFSCSVCHKSFREKSYLRTHMRSHTGEKPFSCSECGKAFKRKQDLRDHIVVHSQEKPFTCTVCKKGFKQRRVLRCHMLIHSGDKPWSCSICKKVFSQKNNLSTHMLIHSGEKPFSCSFCRKAFSRKINLITHMLIHTGEKPYSCPVCKKCYRHQSSIQKHMKSHIIQKTNNTVTDDHK